MGCRIPARHTFKLQTTATAREPSPWAISVRGQNWPPERDLLLSLFRGARALRHALSDCARRLSSRAATTQPSSQPSRLGESSSGRKTFSELFSARPDRFAVHGRPPLAAPRSTPRRATDPFPPPPSSLRPETRCEGATSTSRPATCAGSWSTSSAVVGARGFPRSLSVAPLLSGTHSCLQSQK